MKNATYIFLFLVIGIIEVNAMSFFNHYSNMNWEWPAGRQIKYEITVEVIRVSAIKRFLKSPSFAKDLPDPMLLKGKVLKGGHLNVDSLIELALPKVDLGGITKGSIVMLGMVDDNTVISIKDMAKAKPR